jgi:DNA ligase-1
LGHISVPELWGVEIDGKVYAHGESFQENMKLIKKYRPGKTESIKYHVYDIISESPFKDRTAFILKNLSNLPNIEIVPTYEVINEAQILEYHTLFISQGYEGTIVRHSNEGYQVNKRSSQLLKYKDFIDETFEVVDIIPSESRPDQGVIVCSKNMEQAGENVWVQHFNCGMKFSHFDRKVMLDMKEEFIGRKAEVRFFEYTDGGLPRFPVCVGFRED